MKGIAKIELIDAKTGITKQTIEKNIITPLFENFLTEQAKMIAQPWGGYKTGIYGLYSEYGGILLLGDSQNISNVYPHGKIIATGDSGTVKSDNHGILIESGSITGGYKYVWQWDTDQANDIDINAVSLVKNNLKSQLGAFTRYATAIRRPMLLAQANRHLVDGDFLISDGVYLKRYSPKPCAYYFEHDYAAVDRVVNFPNETLLTIGSVLLSSDDTYYYLVENGQAAVKKYLIADNSYIGVVATLSEVVSASDYFEVTQNKIILFDQSAVTLKIFNKSTGVLEKTIVMDYSGLDVGHYTSFVTSEDETHVYLTVGIYQEASKIRGLFTVDIINEIVNFSFKQSVDYSLGVIPISPMKNGIGMFSDFSNDTYYKYVRFGVHPLAMRTINNLGTPIQKTASDILKITYTLLYA